MAAVKFYKVTTTPSVWAADSIYFIQNGAYAEIYITTSLGEPKKVGNTPMIQELTQNINAGFFT
jgi:hypothetical protein